MALVQDFRRTVAMPATLLAAAAIACCSAAAAQDAGYREALRIAVERIRYSDDIPGAATHIAAGALVAEFYERRSFLPAWRDDKKIASLIAVIEDAFVDGLEPADYHLRSIEEQFTQLSAGQTTTPAEWAAFELELTDALIGLVHHQRFGKADPLGQHATWNFRGRGEEIPDTLQVVEQAMNASSLREFLDAQIPRGPYYRGLRRALASYRRIASEGGWPTIAGGPSLDYGTADERIATLAARLAITGDIDDAEPYAATRTMDGRLQDAVRRFQWRHGLEVDGVVGPATRGTLNVPVEQRIEQLRLTLERARWVLDGLGETFVVVNIAGFRAYVVADRNIIWETRVVVGKAGQQTPVFRDELQYIVFNPTWTVPYSIATREMLPEIKAHPGWFETRDFEVRNRTGDLVDPSSVDWSAVTRRNFDYVFVQRAGSNNALGKVKFVFPNEHAVYLHDTPARQLFGSAERAFSHGCIRVEDPLELAEILLGPNGWDRERIDAAVANRKTTTVFLTKPLPVLLLYWTANVDPDGVVHFYRDVYQRDPAMAKALGAPFRIQPPPRPDGLL
jgi:murein L,D-transpeptidase YcbB/YkuD